jgi:hypothetical protein
MFTVRAPNTAHNGITAGVRFTAGVGQTDSPAALAYFARAGYTIELQPLQAEGFIAEPHGWPAVEIVPSAYEGLTKKQLVALAAERGLAADPRANNAVLREALIAAALAAEEANSVPTPDVQATSKGADPFAPGADG